MRVSSISKQMMIVLYIYNNDHKKRKGKATVVSLPSPHLTGFGVPSLSAQHTSTFVFTWLLNARCAGCPETAPGVRLCKDRYLLPFALSCFPPRHSQLHGIFSFCPRVTLVSYQFYFASKIFFSLVNFCYPLASLNYTWLTMAQSQESSMVLHLRRPYMNYLDVLITLCTPVSNYHTVRLHH